MLQVFFISFVYLSFGHYECIHDSIQHMIPRVTVSQNYNHHPFDQSIRVKKKNPGPINRILSDQNRRAFHSIRIHIDTTYLYDDSGKMCTKKGQHYTSEKMGRVYEEGTAKICSINDILTNEKLKFLRFSLLPAAKRYFESALRVVPIRGRMTMGGGLCGKINIPDKYTSRSADFILMVTARPTEGEVTAWAASCRWDQYDRPIVGIANFGPNHMNISPSTLDRQIDIAIHEIAHALGFSTSDFKYFRDEHGDTRINPMKEMYRLGMHRSFLTTPNLLEKAREHFKCPELFGVEMENYDARGTAKSHFEKRILMHEGMTGHVSHDVVFSALFLAVFQDSGWYEVDYSMAETLQWGYHQGCSFVQGSCDQWHEEANAFCRTQGEEGCTGSINQFIGVCNMVQYSSALPSQYQYFENPLMGGRDAMSDFCPYIQPYANGDCRKPENAQTNNYFGQGYASSSRCFKHTLLRKRYIYDGDIYHGCYETKCSSEKGEVILNVKVGSFWLRCPIHGGDLEQIPDFNGKIVCPSSNTVCVHTTTSGKCPNDCAGRGACSQGKCQCNPPYSGEGCEIVNCPGGCAFGTCNDTVGICVCQKGYKTNSETKKCDICENGFSGNACEIIQCSNGCGFGTCDLKTGVCLCNTGYNMVAYTGRCDICADHYFFNWQNVCVPDITIKSDIPGVGVVNLITGQAQSGLVAYNKYIYYRSSTVHPFDTIRVDIRVIKGDPDLFASFIYTWPSLEHHTWLSGGDKDETILLNPRTYQKNIIAQKLHISVLGSSHDTQFEIKVTITSQPCDSQNTCNGHGSCNRFGECKCWTGWSGSDCSVADCPGVPDCNRHGICYSDASASLPVCICDIGWSGNSCENIIDINSIEIPVQYLPIPNRLILNLALGDWIYYRVKIEKELSLSVHFTFSKILGNMGDHMMFVHIGEIPIFRKDIHMYRWTFFDIERWEKSSDKQEIRTFVKEPTTFWIGVYNNPYWGMSPLNGTLTVTFISARHNAMLLCSPERTCNNHGKCVYDACVCDDTYHGIDCRYQMNELLPGVITFGQNLLGSEYHYFYIMIADEEEILVKLSSFTKETRPRLFIQKAPNLPRANGEAYTDYISSQTDLLNHSIRISGKELENGIWYIGVYNAGTLSLPMAYHIEVKSSHITSRKTIHCVEQVSNNCNDYPPLNCPENSIITQFFQNDVWYKQTGSLINEVEEEFCTNNFPSSLCHEQCSEMISCIGKTSCVIPKCILPKSFSFQCPDISNLVNNTNLLTCGMVARYECVNMNGNVTKCSERPCAPHGSCKTSNGLAVCECQNGWFGSDCRTPPLFDVKHATLELQYIPEPRFNIFSVGNNGNITNVTKNLNRAIRLHALSRLMIVLYCFNMLLL